MILGLALAWLVCFLATVGVIVWRAARQSRSWNDLAEPPASVALEPPRRSDEDVGGRVGQLTVAVPRNEPGRWDRPEPRNPAR
jgi:hypothetical protein